MDEQRISDSEWQALAYARQQAEAAQRAYAEAMALTPAIDVYNQLRDGIYARYGLGSEDLIDNGRLVRKMPVLGMAPENEG